MKNATLSLLLLTSIFVFAGCASGPANVDKANTNAANENANISDGSVNANQTPSSSANTNEAPTAEKSPGQANLPEANFPQIVEEIHRRVNEFRQSQGLQPLKLNPIISEQAREHSEQMAKTPDTISHENFDERITEIRKQLPFQSVGENVAANLNYSDPAAQSVEGWKNSPKHRKNMLGDFNQTGIGVARAENGSYFFTQIFWKP